MGGMEAALASGILKIVGDKLAPLVIEEFSSVMGVTKDLRELQDLVEEIKSWLRAVGDRSIENQPSFNWLKGLKDVAYDVEDLVDEFHLEAEKHEVYAAGDKHVVAKYLSAKQKSVLFRWTMAHKIKTIRKKFHAIVKNRSDVSTIVNNLPVDPVQDTNKTIGELPLLGNVGESYIRVRDMERHDIISKLVEINDGEKIQIISIVGLGGTGKTTLAKHICQDNETKGHFESTFLVHVSRDFDVVKLIEKLFEAVVGEKSEPYTLQRMSRDISEKLSGRKFLLVLDDVWNGDQHDWEQFMVHVNNGAPGSRILLTTRDQKVAEALGSTRIFNLAFLSENDSWKLFQKSLGWAEQDLLDSEFTQVGKEIVMKCGGVPLAIKVLAGVLRQKRRTNAWQAIRESNLWNEQDIECRVFATLRLSYFHLPDQLKQCFTYCSIFPKGYEIYKDDLITQWIAQGFVNPTSEVEQPEDIGSDYFDSLLKVSFLQDLVEDYRGRLRCKMHDLVHDLTRHILQDEMVSMLENTTSDHTQRCRYLSLTSCTGKVDRKLFNKVRALYVSGANLTVDKPIKKGCCVRTVILERISATSLPQLISRFEHLGYLKISNVNCEALPDVLSRCWNLQALHVTGCARLVMLPEFIGNLKKLRILEVADSSDLESLPQSIGDCRNLQSLHLLDCRKLTEIPDSIGKIEKLKVLRIVGCWNLRHLPSESFGMLSNLQILDVSNCSSLQELPSSFPCCTLRRLELSGTSLTILPQCITLLSALEYIDLEFCKELVELPEGVQSLTRLEVLNLHGCDRLRGLPAGFGQLTRLRRLGLFVIGGSGDDAGISDLEHLDMVSGELEIKNIVYVKDEDDAEKAYLKRKNNIQELSLAWYSKWEVWTSSEEEFDMEKDLGVLNGLEPPSQIEALEISGYRGLHLPRWMRKQSDPSYFPRLSKLTLGELPNLTHLRGLVDLISLETLELRAMPNLVELPENLTSLQELKIEGCSCLGMLGEFRSLWSLHIGYCDALRQLPEEIGQLRSLEILCIGHCAALRQLPEEIGELRSLRILGIVYCDALRQLPEEIGQLRSLEILCIGDCAALRQLPEEIGKLRSLLYLLIRHCAALHQLPEEIGQLRSLQTLLIRHCAALRQLPEEIGQLRSLRILEIEDCDALRQLPEEIGQLRSLQRLWIESCAALRQLPEEIGELRSLQNLRISSCAALHQLPEEIGQLRSLQILHIGHCAALRQLPEEIGELRSLQSLKIFCLRALTCLPESMQRLTSLEDLNLIGCAALTQLPESIGQISALRWFLIQGCPGLGSLPPSTPRLRASIVRSSQQAGRSSTSTKSELEGREEVRENKAGCW